MRRAFVALAFSASLVTPAQSQGWIVYDPAAVAKAIATYNQITSELNLAKQMAADIPATFQGTNIPAQLQAVTRLIQQAQTACPPSMQTAKVLPSACMVKVNVANLQGAQMSQNMVQLQSLQNLARGSTGTLQTEKANALALIQLSTQISSMQSAALADAKQQQIDSNRMNAATTQRGSVNPWANP
jgi:hypothetical protein